MSLILEEKRLGLIVMYFSDITLGTLALTIVPSEILGPSIFGFSGSLVAFVTLEVIIRRLIRKYQFESGIEELIWFAYVSGIMVGYDYIIIRHFPAQVSWPKLLIIGLIAIGYHAYYIWSLIKRFQKEPGILKKRLWLVARLHLADSVVHELVIK